MALWDRLATRGRVEDRRGMSPITAGGMGLGGVALYLFATVLLGGEIDLATVLTELERVPQSQEQITDSTAFEGLDSYEVFASTVLGSNNQLWERIFSQNNRQYQAPRLVLFRTATQSACGTATSRVGPHYCPLDSTIYVDETFFEELQTRFGAQGGDVAEAYVIAHEVGHHVQNELGILDRINQQLESALGQSNQLSVQRELQADCLAGLWANSIQDLDVFQPGEIQEALDAAASVGDDRIQEKVIGSIEPESWTHGSSEQRVEWFTKGFESGNPSECGL